MLLLMSPRILQLHLYHPPARSPAASFHHPGTVAAAAGLLAEVIAHLSRLQDYLASSSGFRTKESKECQHANSMATEGNFSLAPIFDLQPETLLP